MVFERLGDAIKGVMNKIANAVFVDKSTIEPIITELKRSLLSADVDSRIVDEICEKIRKVAFNESIKGIERKEQLIKLIHDEIVRILGKEGKEIKIDKKAKPYKIMFLGLYGCGKTTTSAKLSLYYSKRGYKCSMLGLDVHRPAASDQLEQLGKKISVSAFINKNEKNALSIYRQYEEEIKGYDICFIDTAGRDALDSELITEIINLTKAISPNEIILVMPADIGQAARKQVEQFKKVCNISGVIITRMDGTAKGGGALVACGETNSSVLFMGTGEHIHDIETFNPTSFVSRMLGMGDLNALLEKVKTAASPIKEIKKDKFTLIEFYEQIKASQSLGSMDKIMEFIPGLGSMKIPSGMLESQQNKMKKWKHAIDSMTLKEIESPELIKDTRIARIAKGSGTTSGDIRDLINQYNMIKSMMNSSLMSGKTDLGKIAAGGRQNLSSLGLSQGQLRKLAKRMGRF
ncbi:MAG: signal recognition particle receptor subunit alpha [archaeon]